MAGSQGHAGRGSNALFFFLQGQGRQDAGQPQSGRSVADRAVSVADVGCLWLIKIMLAYD